MRQSLVKRIREQLVEDEFYEFETPVLGERIEEYAAGLFRAESSAGREFWLAQSPQLFKQMLMAAGYRRYFQFAHCFRDEPHEAGRLDRLREFIQIDFEMATSNPGDIRRLIERVFQRIGRDFGREVDVPFPEIDARTAVDEFGSDRPDLRADTDDWSFVWVVNFPLAERDEQGVPRLIRHPMALPMRAPIDAADACEVETYSYDLVLNGYEIASGDLRIHDATLQEAVLRAMSLPPDRFSSLLQVLESGCPPHGGAGIGLDRLAMALAGETDIAQVSAFPDWFGCLHREGDGPW